MTAKAAARNGLALLLLVVGLAAAELIVSNWARNAQHQQREIVVVRAAELRASLENAISSTAYLAQGLSAFVRSVEVLEPQQVNRALSVIYEADGRIRNIGLAPDNVLKFVYPVKGNEAAVGLRYADVPAQWPSVAQAMESKRSVLAGPVNLVQGGTAIINRTPVFLESEQYWGIISLVIDLEPLLEQAGIINRGDGLRVQVIGDRSSQNSGVVMGDGPIDSASAVRMPIRVPGGTWSLLALPRQGWQAFSQAAWALRVQLYLVVAVMVGFVLLLLNGQAQARVMARDLQQLNDDLAASNEALEYMSRYDALTNVANRRYFDEMLARSWANCRRNDLPMSVLMVDVDHFKSINDNFGHETGDACLVRIAALILNTLRRADDFVARYGGEEFVVMAAGLNGQQATILAERIRAAIGGTLIEHREKDKPPLRMTVSVGVSTRDASNDMKATDLCREADEALYTAKRTGRNKVVRFGAEVTPEPMQS